MLPAHAQLGLSTGLGTHCLRNGPPLTLKQIKFTALNAIH